MTSTQTTAAGAVPAARLAPDDHAARTLPGRPFPLGATPSEQSGVAGTNFAIASSVADSVTFCLFDETGAETQIPVQVHDGFTMRDLGSYDDKHNQANGEDNRDGTSDNRSWNCGTEGPADDPDILALRARQARAMLTTLLLSFGVPLLLGGDELGRTQQGNNNAYCQDNEITWFDWENADTALLAYAINLIEFRRDHPVFRRRRFLTGIEATQLEWFTPAGAPMDGGDWAGPNARAIAIYLNGSDDPDRAEDGTFLIDDDFLVLVNSWWEPLDFVLPQTRPGAQWHAEIDSYDPATPARAAAHSAGEQVTVGPRSVVVLKSPRPAPPA
jgi:isoamylase